MNRKDKTYLEIINSVSKIINEDVNVLNSKSKINDFVNWAFKEYERLIQESPLINESTIETFKKKFNNLCYE